MATIPQIIIVAQSGNPVAEMEWEISKENYCALTFWFWFLKQCSFLWHLKLFSPPSSAVDGANIATPMYKVCNTTNTHASGPGATNKNCNRNWSWLFIILPPRTKHALVMAPERGFCWTVLWTGERSDKQLDKRDRLTQLNNNTLRNAKNSPRRGSG